MVPSDQLSESLSESSGEKPVEDQKDQRSACWGCTSSTKGHPFRACNGNLTTAPCPLIKMLGLLQAGFKPGPVAPWAPLPLQGKQWQKVQGKVAERMWSVGMVTHSLPVGVEQNAKDNTSSLDPHQCAVQPHELEHLLVVQLGPVISHPTYAESQEDSLAGSISPPGTSLLLPTPVVWYHLRKPDWAWLQNIEEWLSG